ncbi:hypothetical protein HBI24_024870 [Parastagonospora nodorum]|nr:hypothetical protein HBH51_130970 [Parastagonospora nodorum]KAH4000144.1 hypothetical protein HBI10_104840 [Parastagonospora nodorum]KAH4017698.1 hypothetical protein HBI09_193260 [Parastagonospora nodorum]KAH4073865.1 hypothetical protein HBH50_039410 [Parastagonospora nodorum]KAH4091378.1 hypothetical protein HBH48_091730 [Parastagonospora nodorum]
MLLEHTVADPFSNDPKIPRRTFYASSLQRLDRAHTGRHCLLVCPWCCRKTPSAPVSSDLAPVSRLPSSTDICLQLFDE